MYATVVDGAVPTMREALPSGQAWQRRLSARAAQSPLSSATLGISRGRLSIR